MVQAVRERVATVSANVRSIVTDNKKCLVIIALLAAAYLVWKNCSCTNPWPDVKKGVRQTLTTRRAPVQEEE